MEHVRRIPLIALALMVPLVLSGALSGSVGAVAVATHHPAATPPPPTGWTYDTGTADVKDVAVAGDGGYVAATTSADQLYLFNSSSNTPEAIWQLGTSVDWGTLAISAAPPVINGKVGTSSYVMVGVGGTASAFAFPNATALWSYNPGPEILDKFGGKAAGFNMTSLAVGAIAISASAQIVAAGFTFEVTSSSASDYGVWLSYLNGNTGAELWNFSQTSSTGAAMSAIDVSMTSDGSYLLFAFQDGTNTYVEVAKYSGSPPPLEQETSPPSGSLTEALLSPDGSTVIQVGSDGYWIDEAANVRTTIAENDTNVDPGTPFSGSALAAFSYNASRLVVDGGGNTIYGFNYSSAPPPQGYEQPIWSMPTSTYPMIYLALNPAAGSYGEYVSASSAGSTVAFFYVPGYAVASPVPYRTVQLSSTALSASSSTNLEVTAVGMSARGGSAQGQLDVLFDYGPSAPPALTLSASDVTYDSFLLSWTPSDILSLPGSPTAYLTLSPPNGPQANVALPASGSLNITGLSSDKTYLVQVTVDTWWGLFNTYAALNVTTFPPPPAPDPFAWTYPVFSGLLSAGFVFTAIAMVLTLPEKRAVSEDSGARGSGSLFGKRSRGSPKKTKSRRSSSTRLPPGFGGS